MALDWDAGKADAVGGIMSTAPASAGTGMAGKATMSVSVAIPSGMAAGRAQTVLLKVKKAIIPVAGTVAVMDMSTGIMHVDAGDMVTHMSMNTPNTRTTAAAVAVAATGAAEVAAADKQRYIKKAGIPRLFCDY